MDILQVISHEDAEWPGDIIVNFNGDVMFARNIPDSYLRKSIGIGHFNPYDRPVVKLPEGDWPYSPEYCELADFPFGHWDREGTVLICAGCGLDCT